MNATTAAAQPGRTADAKKGAPAKSYWALLKQTAADWSEDNCTRLAAALSCYTVLSLAPLVVILFKIMSVAFRGPQAQDKLKGYINGQVESLSGFSDPALIDTIIQKSLHQSSGTMATLIGVAVLLVGASGVFGELQSSMNTIWEVKPKPNLGIMGFVRQRFLSMSMVLGVAFLLLVSLFISTVVTGITKHLFGAIKVVGILTDLLLSLGVATVLFAMIYKLLPDVKLKWKYVWLGGVLTAALFAIGKWGLTLYFHYAAPTSAYGAFGSLAAVVIWVYYSSMILFFGAELTKVYARAQGEKLEPSKYAVPMTEEARVQQGIPHEQTVWNAVAEDNVDRSGGGIRPKPAAAGSAGGARTYAAAGAGLALGVLGALGWANTTKNRLRRQAAVLRLGQRLNCLERRAGHATRLHADLANLRLAERIHQVESRICRAAQVAQRGRSSK